MIAGFDLRALGRLAESAQPMQAALGGSILRKRIGRMPPTDASNLSELYLTLGDVQHALDVRPAERRAGRPQWRWL